MISTDEIVQEPMVVDEPQQEQQAGQPDPPNRRLYNKLNQDKLYTKSYEDFQKQFSTPEAINKLHSKLNQDGLYTKTKEEFEKQFFPNLPKPTVPSKPLITPAKPRDFNALQAVGINNEFQGVPKSEPAQPKEFNALEVAGLDKPFISKEQYAIDKHSQVVESVKKTISGIIDNDKVLKPLAEKMLIEDRQKELRNAASNVNVGATDHPVNIPTGFGLQVQPQEVEQFANDIKQDPELQVKALLHEKKVNPKESGKIDKALYIVHANDRAVNADKQVQIAENADKIEKGELKYIPESGKLIKPEGLGASLDTSFYQRENDIALFDLADNGSDEDLVKKLNELNADHDPDKAIPTPTGVFGGVGEFLGGQGKVMTQVIAAQALNALPVIGTAAAESISGGLFAHEMARRGYAHELQRSYGEYKRQGLTDEQAVEKAKEQAKRAMIVDAGTAALMGAATSAAGSKILKAVPEAEVMANTIKANKLASEGGWYHGVIKSGFDFVKKQSPAAISNATLAGGGEILKNLSAEADGGINRDATEGAADAAINMAKLHYTLSSAYALIPHLTAAVEKGTSGAKKIYRETLQGFTKVPIEDAKAIGQDLVKQKLITPQENAQNIAAIEAHIEADKLIPKSVKNDEVRLKLQDIVRKREATSEEKSKVSSAFADPLKLKIEKYDEQINEIANSPEAKMDTPDQVPEKPKVTVSTPIIRNVKMKGEAEPVVEPVPVESVKEEPAAQVVDTKEMTGVTHAETDAVAKEMGLPTYEEKPETVAEWDAEAAKRIKDDPETVNRLISKLQKGGEPDKVEQRIMAKYLASLKAKFNETRSDEVMQEYARAKKLSDEIGGREVAKSLVARKALEPVEDSLVDFMYKEQEEINHGTPLTEEQKKTVTKEYEDLNSAKDKFQSYVDKKNAELSEREAKLKVEQSAKSVRKKSEWKHEDFVKDRKDIITKMREDLLKVAKGQGGLTASVPGLAQLVAVTPHVAKLVKSLAEEGIIEFKEVLKNVHEHLKEVMPGIEKEQVRDIIAGKYIEDKGTRNEAAAKLFNYKQSLKDIQELEKLQSGKFPERRRSLVKRNLRIKELTEKIHSLLSDSEITDPAKLEAAKSRIKSDIVKQQKVLDAGGFLPESKSRPVVLDEEGVKLKDDLLKIKEDIDIRRMQNMYDKRSGAEKAASVADKVISSARVLQTSFDVSMPGRQGIWGIAKQLLSLPIGDNAGFKQQKALAGQFGKMYKALASPKISRRIMSEIHESPRFENSQKAGLHLEEPTSKLAKERLDMYGPAYINEVPFIGQPIKLKGGGQIGGLTSGSERAATVFVNSMKWDIYNGFVDIFEKQGRTFQNSKEFYESAATYANQAVGRGKIPNWLDTATPLTKHMFYSVKLQASRLQLLTNFFNPRFYWKTPAPVRNAYLRDMVKFVAFGSAILATANAAGLKVGVNPYASDFGKIHVGDTQFDIWGGFSQWATFLMRFAFAKKTDTHGNNKDFGVGMKDDNRLSLALRFARSKAAPEASFVYNLSEGKDYLGRETSLKNESLKLATPLLGQDIYQAWQDGGAQQAAIIAVLAAHGVGTQTYAKNAPKTTSKAAPKRATRPSRPAINRGRK